MTKFVIVDIREQAIANASVGIIAAINGAALNPVTLLGLIPETRSRRLNCTIKGSQAFYPTYYRGAGSYLPNGTTTIAANVPYTFTADVTGKDTSFDVFTSATGTFTLTIEIDDTYQ